MNVAIFFIVGHSKKNSTRQHRLLLAEFFYNWLNANVAKTKKKQWKIIKYGHLRVFFYFPFSKPKQNILAKTCELLYLNSYLKMATFANKMNECLRYFFFHFRKDSNIMQRQFMKLPRRKTVSSEKRNFWKW